MSKTEIEPETLVLETKKLYLKLQQCNFTDLSLAVNIGYNCLQIKKFVVERGGKLNSWIKLLEFSSSMFYRYVAMYQQYPELIDAKNRSLFNFINFTQATALVNATEEFRLFIIKRLKSGENFSAKAINILKQQYDAKHDDVNLIDAKISRLIDAKLSQLQKTATNEECRKKELEQNKNALTELHLAFLAFNENFNAEKSVGEKELRQMIRSLIQDARISRGKMLYVLQHP